MEVGVGSMHDDEENNWKIGQHTSDLSFSDEIFALLVTAIIE